MPEPTPVSPTPTPAPAPAVEPAAPPPEKKGMKNALDRLKSIADGKGDPAKPVAKEEVKEVVKEEKPLPSGDKELDAEIETVTKDLSQAQKKAFTHKTYELRDMKRKLAESDAKGKDTESLQAKVTELETKLAAAPKETVDPKEIEAYKEQVKSAQEKADALSKELEIAAVERTEEFKRAVTLPKKAIEDRVKALAEKYEIAPKALVNALYGTPEDQVEAAEKLNEPERVKFFNDALKLADLDERGEILRQNAAEANIKIAAKREAEAKAQAEQRTRVFAETHKANWKALTESLPILTGEEADKASKWSGETDFTALDAAQQTSVLQRASVFPILTASMQAKDAEMATVKAELATANEALEKFRANKAGGEATSVEEIVPTKPQGRMAERFGAKIAQLGGR